MKLLLLLLIPGICLADNLEDLSRMREEQARADALRAYANLANQEAERVRNDQFMELLRPQNNNLITRDDLIRRELITAPSVDAQYNDAIRRRLEQR